MLIHKNDPFNSLLVKESERLIRSQKYVHDVSFYVASAGKGNDSVDIFIRELDNWSIIPEGAYSHAGYHFGLTDKNFLGTGHEFKNHLREQMQMELILLLQIIQFRTSGTPTSVQSCTMKLTVTDISPEALILNVRFFPLWQSGQQGYLFLHDSERILLNYADPLYIP